MLFGRKDHHYDNEPTTRQGQPKIQHIARVYRYFSASLSVDSRHKYEVTYRPKHFLDQPAMTL